MNDNTYFDRARRDIAEWYASQDAAHLRCVQTGAWDANDVDRYSLVRAELRRREIGGTLWDHFALAWH
jgi:hypothetical protein